jgi:hypothetical protein
MTVSGLVRDVSAGERSRDLAPGDHSESSWSAGNAGSGLLLKSDNVLHRVDFAIVRAIVHAIVHAIVSGIVFAERRAA